MTNLRLFFVTEQPDSHNSDNLNAMRTHVSASLVNNLRHKQVDKLHAWKFFLHFFGTYGTKRRA